MRCFKSKLAVLLAVSMISVSACGQRTCTQTIRGSKGALKAVIHLPRLSGSQKCPFVLVMHGFTGNKDEAMLVQISEGLQKRGIGSVRFDFNGHGESDGRFQDMTIGNEIEDAKAVLSAVKAIGCVDSARIGLLGHSQGGVVTGMLAGELGAEQVKAIVQLAPAGNIGEGVRKGRMLGVSVDVNNIPEFVEVWQHKVGRAYIQYAMNADMYGVAAKYKGKACVIHGGADTTVPCEYGKRFADGFEQGKWICLPGDTHGLRKHRSQALGAIYDFFKKNL